MVLSTVLKGVHISHPSRIYALLAPAVHLRAVSLSSSAHSYSTYSPLLSPASTSASPSRATFYHSTATATPTPKSTATVSTTPSVVVDNNLNNIPPNLISPDPNEPQPPSPSPSPLPLPGVYSYPHCNPQQQLHSACPSDSSVTTPSDLNPFSLPRPRSSSKAASSLFSSSQLFISSLPHLLSSPIPKKWPMASAPYPYSSSASSDISTPRSSSPSPSTGRSSHTSISNRMSISLARRTSNFNPMSSIDMQAIEEAMKAQQLDQLRGYRKDTYGEVKQTREPVYVTELSKRAANGQQVLREPTFNKGNT